MNETKRVHSLKKQIRFTILVLGISLALAFFAGITYNFYFIPHVYSVKNDVENQLKSLVTSNGKGAPFSPKSSHLLDEISSIPFVTHEEVQKIENSLSELKKSSNHASVVLRVMKKVDVLVAKVFHKITEIFMIIFMLTIAFSIVATFFLHFSLRRRIFSEIESISTDLSKLDFSYVPKLKKFSYVETKGLTEGFNSMVRHVGLYKLVLDANVNSKDLNEFAKKLYDELKRMFKINRLSIAEVIKNKMIVSVALSDSKNVIVGEGFTQNVDPDCLNGIREKKISIVNDIQAYLKDHPESSMNFIYEEGMKSAVSFPLYTGGKYAGILFLNSFEKNAFKESDVESLKVVSNILSHVYKKMLTIQNLILSIINGFTELVEEKDEETGDHLIRMALYSQAIAQELAKNPKFFKILNPKFIEQIYKQAPLHDIGKVGVPDYILQKPGKLSDDEFEIMKTHTLVGYKILNHVESQSHEKFFEIGKNIVRSHHERWDGNGYPDKLKGEKIPLCARIVAVADVFDALTSERPYKKAFDYDKSVRIIIEESNTHFDPEVVNAFIRAQPKIEKLYKGFHKFLHKKI